ncbi:MAG: EAL domain-containing protein [Gammaproteobacteria bacterium]
MPPEAVEIELTETSILRAEQSIFKTLPALKELGIQLALDDFGTGYSSLRVLPVDKLKIDTSFVISPWIRKTATIVSAYRPWPRISKSQWSPRARNQCAGRIPSATKLFLYSGIYHQPARIRRCPAVDAFPRRWRSTPAPRSRGAFSRHRRRFPR